MARSPAAQTRLSLRPDPGYPPSMLKRALCNLTGVKEDELGLALASGLLFFLILTGYYILRPLREEMGLAGGVENLPYLYLVNLGVMLLMAPAFGWVATRWSRGRFVPGIYLFFMLNLLVFYGLLRGRTGGSDITLGRVFFVWISVYNMWAVSLFWAFMADGFVLERGKRLFGFISVGGSAGAVLGSTITAALVDSVGRVNLVLVSAAFLFAAAAMCHRLGRVFAGRAGDEDDRRPLAPAPTAVASWRGVTAFVSSPYLLMIGAYIFLYTLSATFLYFQQAQIVDANVIGRAARARVFANIDQWTNILTFTLQLFLTGRLIGRLGVGTVLMILPLAAVAGFTALSFAPVLPVLIVFQVVRRAGSYALSRPARETLFTIVDREQKYKAKSFIDTFVYRGGDVLGAGIFAALGGLGLSLGAIALVAVPPAILWAVCGRWLGRRQERLARARAAGGAGPAATSR